MTDALLKLTPPQILAEDPARLARRLSLLDDDASKNSPARKAAEQFESLFLTQMLEHMSIGVKTDGPFGGGQGEQMFRSLLNQEYAGALAKRGGIGLAEHIYRQILSLQEV